MKSLLAVFVCCWALAAPLSSARAAYPLSLRGGIASPYAPTGLGGQVSATVGWYPTDEVPPETSHIYEVLVGAPYFYSNSSDQNTSATVATGSQITQTSAIQLALAPGVRFVATKYRLQPFFALHAGWFPMLTTTTTNDAGATPAQVLKQTAVKAFDATYLGANLELGLRLALTDRFAVGLQAATLLARQMAANGKGFSGWQALASLTVDLGALRK